MNIFAHRGFSGAYPENTMLAFKKAAEVGSDGIELDVHLSKDGKLVIIHDELLKRTTGREGLVSDYSLKALMAIPAGITKDDQYDTPIPSFEEYCAFAAKTNLITNIEIKTNRCWYQDIEQKAVDMVKAFGLEGRVIFSSFNWLSVARVKQLAPELPCALLYEDQRVRHLPLQARDLGMQFIHPDFQLLDEEAVLECREQGIGLNVWTINDESRMSRLIEWKVSGVISNFPDLCLKALQR